MFRTRANIAEETWPSLFHPCPLPSTLCTADTRMLLHVSQMTPFSAPTLPFLPFSLRVTTEVLIQPARHGQAPVNSDPASYYCSLTTSLRAHWPPCCSLTSWGVLPPQALAWGVPSACNPPTRVHVSSSLPTLFQFSAQISPVRAAFHDHLPACRLPALSPSSCPYCH